MCDQSFVIESFDIPTQAWLRSYLWALERSAPYEAKAQADVAVALLRDHLGFAVETEGTSDIEEPVEYLDMSKFPGPYVGMRACIPTVEGAAASAPALAQTAQGNSAAQS